jgi:hypothetical protein
MIDQIHIKYNGNNLKDYPKFVEECESFSDCDCEKFSFDRLNFEKATLQPDVTRVRYPDTHFG